MTTFDLDAVADARERLPERGDVPTPVAEALEPREVPGYERERPLSEKGYQAYPSEDPRDILKPRYGEVLAEVCDHPAAESVGDVSRELGVSEDLVREAATLHEGVELPDGADGDGGDANTLTFPQGGEVSLDHLRTPPHEDARVLHTLVVDAALGVGDVVTWFDRQEGVATPSARDIKNALKRVGLMEGEPTDTDRRTARGERLEVNRGQGRHDATSVDATGITGSHPDDADRIITRRADE
ncbi:hypothetical protein [Halopiger thermotolerans]